MFKNLKKKVEAGAELAAVPTSGMSTLGSSLSSLRRSESKASGISTSASRESLQSLSSNSEATGQRAIRTSSISLGEPPSSAPSVLTPVSETIVTNLMDDNTEMHNVDLITTPSFDFYKETSTNVVDIPLSLVDEPVLDNCTSPVLRPVSAEDLQSPKTLSVSPVMQSYQDSLLKELESLKTQLKESQQQAENERKTFASKEMDMMKLKTELDGYKNIAMKARIAEEKFGQAEIKIADLQQQIADLKLEQKSWKIASVAVEQQSKEKDVSLSNNQRKISDLEQKLNSAKSAITNQAQEIEKYREENRSQKAAVATLDHQMDKLLQDIKNERTGKESLENELKQHRESAEIQIRQLNERIQQISQEFEAKLKEMENNIAAREAENENTVKDLKERISHRDDDLQKLRQVLEDSKRQLHQEHQETSKNFSTEIASKETEIELLKEELEQKDSTIATLEATVGEMETLKQTAEQNLEAKEQELAILKRRSAKDMETKLRERDRQIASLEKQVMELSDRVTQVMETEKDKDDSTGIEYMKNVLLKFITGTPDEAAQLIRAVSVLLKLTAAEEVWVRNMLLWKQSWMPGPRPEFPFHLNGSQPHNGA